MQTITLSLSPGGYPTGRAGTQSPQVMPVVDAIIMAIIPDNGDAIGAGWFDGDEPGGRRIIQHDIEDIRIRFG